MTDNVVLRAEQFRLAIAGKLDEDAVAVGDDPLQISHGDDKIVFTHDPFDGGWCDMSFH